VGAGFKPAYSVRLAFSLNAAGLFIMLVAFMFSLVRGYEEGSSYMPHIICGVAYVLGFLVYYLSLLNGGVIRMLYRNGWWALCAHMVVPIAVVPLAIILLGAFNGMILGIPYLILVGYYISRSGGWWFSTKEGDSSVILFGDQPICMPWMFSGIVELTPDPFFLADGYIPWTFLRLEEIYTQANCHDGSKVIDLSLLEQGLYLRGEATVWYKRDTTLYYPREKVVLDLSGACFDSQQLKSLMRMCGIDDDGVVRPLPDGKPPIVKFPLSLSHDQIFFLLQGKEVSLADAETLYALKVLEVKKANLERRLAEAVYDTGAGETLRGMISNMEKAIVEYQETEAYKGSVAKVSDEDVRDTIGASFWSFVDGFYFLLNNDQSQPVRILKKAVLHERVTPVGVPARIARIDLGISHLFGSNFYRGPAWMFKLHAYKFRWQSPNDKSPREEVITWTRLKKDLYVFNLLNAEARDQFKLHFKMVATIRVVNPYLAHFRIENWLENFETLLIKEYRLLVATAKFSDIYTQYNQYGIAWWPALKAMLCNPKGVDLERRFGIRVEEVAIVDVNPAGMTPEEAAKVQAKAWVAEREADAVAIAAEAEAKKIEKVVGAIIAKGDQGLAYKYFDTLVEAAKGQGNTVFLGSLESIVRQVMSGVGGDKVARAIADLGLNGKQAEQLLAMLAKSELKEKGGVE